VRALQDQYKLTPLGKWGKPRARIPVRRAVYAPPDPHQDPLGPWKSLNAMPEAIRRALIRAAAIGMPLLRQQFLSGDWATVINGWRYPPAEEGRFGDDFLRRAADQSLAGISANDPDEAVYLVSFDDASARKLAPKSRYRLRLAGRELPPVDGFWSLSAYTEEDMNLIPNAAGRFSVGDRTPGLRREPDGGLTIYLQPKSPGSAREPNWLPTSAERPWFVILRMYRPHRPVVQARWKCPGIVKVS
jgi:hypothetical protein